MKCLVLLSGGLDSSIALKLMLEQQLDVEAVNFTSVFCRCNAKSGCNYADNLCRKLKVPLYIIDKGEEYLEIIKNPKYGYGSNINPCIDCRIFAFKKAKELMKDINASFIVTGEVLNQRPMSQHLNTMMLIDKEAGLTGLVLRPLSALHLPVTIPEEKGWVNRNKLLNLQGRSRKEQIKLAEEKGITDYSCPSGGCLLTDPSFTERMKDLMRYKPDFTIKDVNLLKYGRHYRLSKDVKLIVGRNKQENEMIINFKEKNDLIIGLEDFKGPLSLLKGNDVESFLKIAGSITARYGDILNKEEFVKVWYKDGKDTKHLFEVIPAKEEELNRIRI
jgi:tRNA U34 2-thiouridine synthase MnmA/TrmU